MNVYRGDQSFAEFVQQEGQGTLFAVPDADPDTIKRKLAALAVHVVEDLGRDADWADLKDTLKSRAAGKVSYDSTYAVLALEQALRTRGQAIR